MLRGLVTSVFNQLHADVVDLASRITARGSTILDADLTALSDFCNTIYSNNLKSLFRSFYPYAGNDWTAARESLWVPNGVSNQLALVGTAFTSANYTRVTGFKGNGTQGFDTGFSSSGLSNWSYSVYLRTSGNASSQIGTGASTSDYLAQNYSGTTYYSNSSGFADTTTQGWYTAQSLSLLRNGVTLNTNGGITGANLNIYIHGRNSSNSFTQGSDRGIGCAAICTTRTAAQDLIIYNAIQTLMTAFGRQV